MSATTVFARLVEAIKAELLESPALAGGNVSANRVRDWPLEIHEGINVRKSDADPTESTNCGAMYRFEVAIEIVARAAGSAESADLSLAVDPLLSSVDTRLRAADFSAVGVTELLNAAPKWDFSPAEQPVAKVTVTYPFMIHAAAGLLVSS
jgi:hypothetical protein